MSQKKEIVHNYKQIHDSIHGYINLSNIMVWVIDSRQFQRLRKLKQLGSCCYVFHNAVHTRHEHSIGTAYLAGRLLECIQRTTNPIDIAQYLSNIKELKPYYDKKYNGKIHVLDDYIVELIKIAALCHDLGHGPFSHVFDDFFLPYIKKDLDMNDHHEYRSCLLLEQIIKENKKLSKIVSENELQFMKNLINPEKEHQGFIYQIVSNTLNGLDVDKYDYIARDSYVTGLQSNFNCQRLVDSVRVINNDICYQEQAIGDIIELFNIRYKLHKTVYSHKAVISAQYMIVEIFKYLDKLIGLSESVKDMDKFITMTDEFIMTSPHLLSSPSFNLPKNLSNSLQKAKNIISRMESHQLYSHVDTYISNHKIDVTKKQFKNGVMSDILIYRNIIGFVSGNKQNPLDNIYVFKTKDLNKNEPLTRTKINVKAYSLMISSNHQEHLTMIFYKQKNPKIVKLINEEFRQLINGETELIISVSKYIPSSDAKNDDILPIKKKHKNKKTSLYDDPDELFNQLISSDQTPDQTHEQTHEQIHEQTPDQMYDNKNDKQKINNFSVALGDSDTADII